MIIILPMINIIGVYRMACDIDITLSSKHRSCIPAARAISRNIFADLSAARETPRVVYIILYTHVSYIVKRV